MPQAQAKDGLLAILFCLKEGPLVNQLPKTLPRVKASAFAFFAVVTFLAVGLWHAPLRAQERIFRCGNEYTNSAQAAQRNDCKPIEGGSVTVVQPPKAAAGASAGARSANSAGAGAGAKVETSEQRTRDAEARQILEAELRKAETRREELLKAYNQGEPEKEGKESRNHQKYLDRVAEMKVNLDRVESDIAGLRRELGRLSVASSSNTR